MKKLLCLLLFISSIAYGQTGKTTLQETERNRTSLTGGEYFRIATTGANWKLDIDSLLDYMRDSISAAGGASVNGPNYSLQYREGSSLRGSAMFVIDTGDATKNFRFYSTYNLAGMYISSQSAGEAGLYFDANDAEIITSTQDEVHIAQNNLIVDIAGSVTNIKTDSLILDSLAGSGNRPLSVSSTGKVTAGTTIDTAYTNAVSNVTVGSGLTVTTLGKTKKITPSIKRLVFSMSDAGTAVIDSVWLNELGGTPSISDVGTGAYSISLTGAFPAYKTLQFTAVHYSGSMLLIRGERQNDNTYDLTAYRVADQSALDDDISGLVVEIKVIQ